MFGQVGLSTGWPKFEQCCSKVYQVCPIKARRIQVVQGLSKFSEIGLGLFRFFKAFSGFSCFASIGQVGPS